MVGSKEVGGNVTVGKGLGAVVRQGRVASVALCFGAGHAAHSQHHAALQSA